MKIAKGQLRAADYDAIYTRDPAYFIESLLINVYFSLDKRIDRAKELADQKEVFLRWIGFYTNSVKEELTKEISEAHAKHVADLLIAAERKGRLTALANLPLKPSLIGPDRLDMHKVNVLIEELKAKEPKGVTKGDNQ